MMRIIIALLVAVMPFTAFGRKTLTIDFGEDTSHSGSLHFNKEELATVDSLVLKGKLIWQDLVDLHNIVVNGVLTGIDMRDVIITCNQIPKKLFSPDDDDARCNLQYVTLPRVLSRIPAHTFERCNLKSIRIPSSVAFVGDSAFADCSELKRIEVGNRYLHLSGTIAGNPFVGVPTDIQVCVPEGTLDAYSSHPVWSRFGNIKEDAGIYRTADISVSGQNVSSLLGENAMDIDSLHVSGTITADDFKFIRQCVIHGSLTSVDMNDCELEGGEFPKWGFEYSDKETHVLNKPFGLRHFRFPKNVKRIIGDMFNEAILVDFTIPETIEEIGSFAFYNCQFIGAVHISEGVKRIERYAFNDCKPVYFNYDRTMYLPSTVEVVGDSSFGFETDTNSFTLYCNRMTPPAYSLTMIKGPFIGETDWRYPTEIYYGFTLYVPVGAKPAYQSDIYWKWFENIIETPELDGGQSDGINATVLNNANSGDGRIFTLDGRYAGKSLDALQSGIYVVNGKKILK